jgi:hypothetical protein
LNPFLRGAPGPDGMSCIFYQSFWELVKDDLIDLFKDFYHGGLDLNRINFALMTFIPKENDARTTNKS